jgi:hypothetical protein
MVPAAGRMDARHRGAALLLPDTDDLRVEFAPGR